MEILERVAKYQYQDWVELAEVFDKDFAEDIVQEMYLLLHKYKVTEQQMFTNGKPNRGYVFIIIRNIHFQLYNIRKRIDKCELNEEIYNLIDDYNEEQELEWDSFRIKAEDEVNSLGMVR
jgi:DNA-directed RNA polymerase specialized sigma24 family protein